jgi:toxin FitB
VRYLLDTNVLSELRRRTPHPAIASWFEATPGSELFISVLVVGEIRQGIERIRDRDPARAEVFERWLGVLKRDFADRVVPISMRVAEAWGRLNAPRALPVVDSLLAATALVHELTLVTRDTSSLETTGVPLLDPWGE